MKKYVNEQLVDMTADEIAERQAEEKAWADGAAERNLAALRKERNYKLAETDWWASSDLTMTDAQKKYRQDLRDITKSATSLDDVTWPEKP
jgi:hypothetical protein